MKIVILAALLAVSAASYNNNAPGYFGSLAYSNPANSAPSYLTSVNSVNSEPVYPTPTNTPVLTYSALKVDNVSPVSEAYATAEAGTKEEEEEEEHEEEDEDDEDEDIETKNKSESSGGKKNKDSGDRNVYATSAVGGVHEHTTASTHVISLAYKEPEYSPTFNPVVVVSTPAYQTLSTTAVPVYVAEEKTLPYWLRPRNY